MRAAWSSGEVPTVGASWAAGKADGSDNGWLGMR